MVEESAELIFCLLPDGRFDYLNPAARGALGHTTLQLSKLRIWDVVSPDALADFRESFTAVCSGALSHKFDTQFVAADGSIVRATGHLTCGLDPRPPALVRAYFRDITADHQCQESLRAAEASLTVALENEKKASRLDFLTGVSNLRAFFEAGEYETARAERYQTPLTLAYIDLDDFKQVNDRFGHAAGDHVLLACATALRDSVRKTDIVGRVGGDEFAILLPQTSAEAAGGVLAKLRVAFAAAMASSPLPITFSLGIATFKPLDLDFAGLMERADASMYSVKRAGKDTRESKDTKHFAAASGH